MERSAGLDEIPVGMPSGGAERRHLSVVFCDLVGSTALSGEVDPELLGKLLRLVDADQLRVSPLQIARTDMGRHAQQRMRIARPTIEFSGKFVGWHATQALSDER